MLRSGIKRGELDRRLTFIKKLLTTSSSNEDKVDTWVEVDTDPTVFAKKTDLKGDTMIISDRPTYVQNTKFTIDYRDDLTTENRAVCEGRVYQLIALLDNNSSRNRYTDVICNLLDNEVWT